jgi:lipopolysaccharide/colanic/teichoic acid biosynthesis glycosyltransferase
MSKKNKLKSIASNYSYSFGKKKFSNRVKRTLDIFFAIIFLILLIPLFVISAILIFISSGLPIFYISSRRIAENKNIKIFKFRTMVKDAKSEKYRLNELYMSEGFLDIPIESEVYTRVGRILERTQLVETPQLFNIIFNGMSFIGNRPLPDSNIELLKMHKNWNKRFESPSGISGISQVIGKIYLNTEDRLRIESMYSEVYNSSSGNILKCDFFIVYYTFKFVLSGVPLKYEDAQKNLLWANSGIPLNEKK